jgi:hypothetical protein
MTKEFETTLNSAEGPVDGVVTERENGGQAWEFKSIDGTIEVVIAKDEDGEWRRIGGTQPYLSAWVDELAEKIQ